MKKSFFHHLLPQIAEHYGQIGIFQTAHNGPILNIFKFLSNFIYKIQIKMGVNFVKI